ncbi:MAG TPA: haloacid dehalogenase [Methanosarcinaceae archaeon]|nr:haloacid dehalogenase [Methanosarcinaceae archaeon]
MIDEISADIQKNFEAKDKAREIGLSLSREVVRTCGTAIRHTHRGDIDKAAKLLEDARDSLEEIEHQLADHPDIYYSGFVEHAQQEFVECAVVHQLLTKENYNDSNSNSNSNTLPSPQELGVTYAAYLNGLGDVVGELRRHILDLIRQDRPQEGDQFLDIMDDIYSTLMMFDYPDAITRGLRRKSDVARSLIERTRGDLTNAIRQQKLEQSMKKFESRFE